MMVDDFYLKTHLKLISTPLEKHPDKGEKEYTYF
jgi:hypothetical protein